MLPGQFVQKWRGHSLTERSAAQQHFLDLCDLVGHPKPAEVDPVGDSFTFERGAAKLGGGDGWADVWKRGFFGWEYKGPHKDLAKAHQQLLLYRDALENPPLLVVSDTDRIEIHTNFTNTPSRIYTIALEALVEPRNLEILRAAFYDPEQLRPGVTSEAITADAAARIAGIAQRLRDRGHDPKKVARFLDRMVFCLFAEDVELLPAKIFTRLVVDNRKDPRRFVDRVRELFAAMVNGGNFGVERIAFFNGNLFVEAVALELTLEDLEDLHAACALDWGAVDASILGTLFERGLDPSKRSQLGAHYTSREDIETLVEPVVMAPLRREWAAARTAVDEQLQRWERVIDPRTKKDALAAAQTLLRSFHQRLASIKVLDPACGSGNFLYVALQKLLDLEKEVILYGIAQRFPGTLPLVSPVQLYGIEINAYAFELAQMTVWIGYLQWGRANGYGDPVKPILRPMDTFQMKDAVLELPEVAAPNATLFGAVSDASAREPDWPAVDFIIGNPPFLGTKKLRSRLGDAYVEALFQLYGDRIPNFSDLCCYWFEKARAAIAAGRCQRAGLLATQAIRGGLSRTVLQRIKDSGDIFFAVSDRDWILDGAAVHVSLVGFDGGQDGTRLLDGRPVDAISSGLTPGRIEVRSAKKIPEQLHRSFIADVKAGKFDIPLELAQEYLHSPNPHGRPNSDVLLPWINSLDLLRRPRGFWIIDFGVDMPLAQAALYEAPFARVEALVKPERMKVKREKYGDIWWLHARPGHEMRQRLAPLPRFLVTPSVAKHRLFIWMAGPTLPDHQLVAIASPDDYSFGILQSRIHSLWAFAQGTQLRERESGFRYTPTTCFETFPFPEPASAAAVAIADAALRLDELRTAWLNPPEWTRLEILEFPAAVDGPWAAYVTGPAEGGIGTARYTRTVARDDDLAAELKRRTLTALYNQRPTWLVDAHRTLDEAVLVAYGWDPAISDEDLLERLLALNLQRSSSVGESFPP